MSGGGSSRTTQSNELPPELRPIMSQSAQKINVIQDAANLPQFLSAAPMSVAPRTALQARAGAEVPGLFDLAQRGRAISERQVTGANLATSPSLAAARRAFTATIQPRIENTATLAGLGRSTALTNAMAQAEAQYMQPLIEAELAREERGIDRAAQGVGQEGAMRLSAIQAAEGVGGAERAAAQEVNQAAYQDYLRRQALSEQSIYTPFGMLAPTTVGSTSKTSGSSGLFK